jgi:hypothetical protein
MARYYSTWAERQRPNARVKPLVLSELYSDIIDEDRLENPPHGTFALYGERFPKFKK